MEGFRSHPEESCTPEEKQKREVFDAQSSVLENIRTIGFAKYAASMKNLEKAFDPLEHEYSAESGPCACCMDGRTKLGFRAAGSGMLLPEDESAEFLRIHKIKTISAHAECGAAKLYCQREGLPIENADTVAQEWAKNMAEKYGIVWPRKKKDGKRKSKSHFKSLSATTAWANYSPVKTRSF